MSGRARENIILIGLPGSGKSALGKRAAADLRLGYIDTDEAITESAGMGIPEIFALRGEAGFRELETETIRLIASEDENVARGGVVVSTGGGAVLRPENVEFLRCAGKIVFVDRGPWAIARDGKPDEGRPLISSADDLYRLNFERRAIYEKAADIIFRNDGEYAPALERLRSLAVLLGACGGMCLIGDPIGHSLSPFMHSVLFEECGIEGRYGSAHVPPNGLAAAVKCLREGKLSGFNVTKPHKMAITHLIDGLRGDAALSGAVNTVKKGEDGLIGYNTDMEGLVLALSRRKRKYAGSVVTIFGAGGAAAGIAARAAADGARQVNVLCRHAAADVSSVFPDSVKIVTHDISFGVESAEAAEAANATETAHAAEAANATEAAHAAHAAEATKAANAVRQADMLINATPLGMRGLPDDFTDFGFLDMLGEGALVCDLVYEPPETNLLREARERGVEYMNGLPMLIYQGILADEIVFGIQADRERVYGKIMDEYNRRREKRNHDDESEDGEVEDAGRKNIERGNAEHEDGEVEDAGRKNIERGNAEHEDGGNENGGRTTI